MIWDGRFHRPRCMRLNDAFTFACLIPKQAKKFKFYNTNYSTSFWLVIVQYLGQRAASGFDRYYTVHSIEIRFDLTQRYRSAPNVHHAPTAYRCVVGRAPIEWAPLHSRWDHPNLSGYIIVDWSFNPFTFMIRMSNMLRERLTILLGLRKAFRH